MLIYFFVTNISDASALIKKNEVKRVISEIKQTEYKIKPIPEQRILKNIRFG